MWFQRECVNETYEGATVFAQESAGWSAEQGRRDLAPLRLLAQCPDNKTACTNENGCRCHALLNLNEESDRRLKGDRGATIAGTVASSGSGFRAFPYVRASC